MDFLAFACVYCLLSDPCDTSAAAAAVHGAQDDFESAPGERDGRRPVLADPEEGDDWADFGTRKSREKENASDPTRYSIAPPLLRITNT